jgi:DEAD/DEAH box helicase domain-containing protein
LKAGTASGKTLAVALPLFEKLKRGEVRKVIFLYPTLALMGDQRRVMDRLEGVYGFEGDVGTIRGGMSRSNLVDALDKRVIVATPDAVYWFLRKNVKYSHLLIYGLLLADEFVVDEAHLFAGLAAQNLVAFLKRLRVLRRRYFGASLRVHVLTATWPEDGTLDGLSLEAQPIDGGSLVGDVKLQIRREDDSRKRSEALVQEALGCLNADIKNVLLVLNSARKAHIVFNQVRRSGADARRLEEIPDEFRPSRRWCRAF